MSKKPTNSSFWISAFLLALFLVGCETIIDYNLPEQEPKLAVNSFFTPDSVWEVHLSNSKSILDTQKISPVTNALVSVSAPSGATIPLLHTNNGFYRSPSGQKPEGIGLYELTVSAPGYESVSSMGIIPSPVPIQSVDTTVNVREGIPFITFRITFNDPPKEKNYYGFSLFFERVYTYQYDSLWIDTIEERYPIYVYPEETSFVSTLTDTDNGVIFSDDLFDGRPYGYQFEISDPLAFPNPFETNLSVRFVLELRSLSEGYYQYQKSYREQQFTNFDPFAQPVQVYGNIENGFGVFTGYHTFKYPIVLK